MKGILTAPPSKLQTVNTVFQQAAWDENTNRSTGFQIRTDQGEATQYFIDKTNNRPVIAFLSNSTSSWTNYPLFHTNDIIPLNKGGTGTTNYIDYETAKRNWFYDTYVATLNTSTDLPKNWPSGFFYCFLYTGSVNIYCPTSYGILLNYGHGAEVAQIWLPQASGTPLHRQGNATGWSGSTSPTNYGWVSF